MSRLACPCASGLPFDACCGPCLDASRPAATAEALMRSRYCAYTHGNADYLRRTWHASTRPDTLNLDEDATRWLGLQIRSTRAGGPDDATGEVEFVARFKHAGRGHRLHETSRFVREDGRWYYLDGTLHPAREKGARRTRSPRVTGPGTPPG